MSLFSRIVTRLPKASSYICKDTIIDYPNLLTSPNGDVSMRPKKKMVRASQFEKTTEKIPGNSDVSTYIYVHMYIYIHVYNMCTFTCTHAHTHIHAGGLWVPCLRA